MERAVTSSTDPTVQMRVLIAVDASEAAGTVAMTAARLFPKSEVILCSAVPLPVVVSDATFGASYTTALPESMMHEVQDLAGEIAAELTCTGSDAEVITPVGDPGSVICEVAATRGVDVVVVGRNERGWLSHLFSPSISDYVVRHAPCPVLVVRAEPDGDLDSSDPMPQPNDDVTK